VTRCDEILIPVWRSRRAIPAMDTDPLTVRVDLDPADRGEE
jgi:hypothetical protein